MRKRRQKLSGRIANVGKLGLIIGGLWALHAAAVYIPGTGYLRIPVLFSVAAGFIIWRMGERPATSAPRADKSGMIVGLWCWGIAATLSTILNSQTDQVMLTYIVVFLSGGAMLAALSSLTLTPGDLRVAIVGLTVGSLFPLIGGLVAFVGEWGVPDVATAVSAWQSPARMVTYEMATFGNRGNTAGFLLILTPVLLALLFDKRTRLNLRLLCAAALLPITLNFLVLQVRAAFVTLLAALVVVWIFKRGASRLPLLAGALVIGFILFLRFQPDAGLAMTERLMKAITIDTVEDVSVQGRMDAIGEGVRIARNNWLLGIGPGGALTTHSFESAHQFQVQQAMETGFLGLAGVMMLCFGIWISLIRTMMRGRHDETNDMRFTLLIGPATFVTYAIIANAALNNGSVNTWTVVVASMLALMPPFESRVRRRRVRSALAPNCVWQPQVLPRRTISTPSGDLPLGNNA